MRFLFGGWGSACVGVGGWGGVCVLVLASYLHHNSPITLTRGSQIWPASEPAVKTQTAGFCPQTFQLSRSSLGQKICISNKLLEDHDAVGPRTTLLRITGLDQPVQLRDWVKVSHHIEGKVPGLKVNKKNQVWALVRPPMSSANLGRTLQSWPHYRIPGSHLAS